MKLLIAGATVTPESVEQVVAGIETFIAMWRSTFFAVLSSENGPIVARRISLRYVRTRPTAVG
jgi:hypothetical protein